MNRSRMRVSPGALIGVIALVFAVTGAAVALPGKGSVDSGDIKKNAVKSKHIKNKQVKAADVNVASVDGLFGVGLLGGEGDIPAALANNPASSGLPVIGSGDGFASLPVPRGGLSVRDLIVTSDAVETRPIIVGFERNNDNVFLNCAIQIGQTSCQSDAGDVLRLAAGDVLNMTAIAPPSPAPFGGADLTYGYRAVGG